jgi:hypothetical protein
MTLIAFVTMNHVQEATDGSRKCAASTKSQRTAGRCAPDDWCAVESSTREERSGAFQGQSSTGCGREGIEGCRAEEESCFGHERSG